MIRVAAYCRVSTDQEDQANSFESQQRYFRECIQRNPDWELENIYADEGISGTSTRKRRQFNAMIASAMAGEIDLIITKEVSRFARNTLDTLEYTRKLRQRGVGVLFLLDNIDTRIQDGELRLTIMSSIAQEESRKTSQRVKWGQMRRMEQGVVFGGSLLGYDVKNGVIAINPVGAQIVRHIFYQYLYERKGSGVIAKELNGAGVLSSRGNCLWSAATVLKILRNEKYCGDLVQKKTYTPDYLTHAKKYNKGQEKTVVLRDHHPPIIERAIWEAVQQELNRRSRKSTPHLGCGNRHPLSGKIKCGSCSSGFLARVKKTKSGEPYRIWRCGRATLEGTHSPFGCRVGKQIREDDAMDILRQAVWSVEMDWEAVVKQLSEIVRAVLWGGHSDMNAEKRRVEKELAESRQKKEWVLEKYMDQELEEADFCVLNQRCNERIARLEREYQVVRQRCVETGAEPIKTAELAAIIRKNLSASAENDDFYSRLLDHMTVCSDGSVEVVLRGLSARWVFVMKKRRGKDISPSSILSTDIS